MRRIINKKGQSTLEYAVVLALVIAALVFMGWGWYRGAYQKKIMSAADEISGGGQFDIEYTSINSEQTRDTETRDVMTGTATGANFRSDTLSDVHDLTVHAETEDLQTRRGE